MAYAWANRYFVYLEELVLVSATEKAEKLEERREHAQQSVIGVQRIRDRVNRDTRDFIDEANRRLLEAASEDECNRIIEHAEIYERHIAAVGTHMSPYRSASLLSQWRREESGQLDMFDGEGSDQ